MDQEDLAEFFRQQKDRMDLPQEEISAYIARRAAMRNHSVTSRPEKRRADSSSEAAPVVPKRPRVSATPEDSSSKVEIVDDAAHRQSTAESRLAAKAAVHATASEGNTRTGEPMNIDIHPEDINDAAAATSSSGKPPIQPTSVPSSIFQKPVNVPIDVAHSLIAPPHRNSILLTAPLQLKTSSRSKISRQQSISVVSHHRSSKEPARGKRVIKTAPKQEIRAAADTSNVTTPASTPGDTSRNPTINPSSGPMTSHIDKNTTTNTIAITMDTMGSASKPNLTNDAASSKPKETTKRGQQAVLKQNPPKKAPAKKLVKDKIPKLTPPEYAEMLIAKYSDPTRKASKNASENLRGNNIFYTGGDLNFAVESTRKKMEIILKHGGTLVSKYDPQVVTHIVTDAKARVTAKDLGLNSISEIPMHIPTVQWSWVDFMTRRRPAGSSTAHTKLGKNLQPRVEYWKYAAFSERMDAGDAPRVGKLADRGKGKGKARVSDPDYSHISEFTENPEDSDYRSDEPDGSLPSPGPGGESTPVISQKKVSKEDPLTEFYAQAKADVDAKAGWEMEDSDSDDDELALTESVPPAGSRSKASTWTCDAKAGQPKLPSPNQDIVDKLRELQELHKSKLGAEHNWRVFSYNKSLRSILDYPTRIRSFAEARSIRHVGEKTALKIMEIINTGELRRIGYENTDDVRVNKLFQGIFGVGLKTAYTWYANGARTLEDVLAGKGCIKLTLQQEIGIRFYDDINERMPRSEAADIFKKIERIALKIDPKLFIQIMGSFRRGSETCGDIDVLITRPVDDGKTHVGVVRKIWKECHVQGIITEDLVMPDDFNELELIYRGLCRKDKTSKRRRLDFLSVPWEVRGAALLYYTGDAIFNRSLRLKARKNGMALNQRGLFGGVVRSLKDQAVKTNEGTLLAAETEQEILKILNVPWQEPHERVRANVI